LNQQINNNLTQQTFAISLHYLQSWRLGTTMVAYLTDFLGGDVHFIASANGSLKT